jgi:uncharacterized protein YuzE
MKDRYLEVTFRKGKPLAAYLYLPRKPGSKSVRSEKAGRGIVVDFGEDGEAIGLEITAPGAVTVEDINEVLGRIGQARSSSEELAPVAA